MNRQALLLIFLLAILGVAAAAALAGWQARGIPDTPELPSPQGPLRIVSLAPAVTETLFAIGAGELVVGRTEYCDYPAAARSLPTVGTTLTPNYEAIVRLKPTLILGEATKDAPLEELNRIAPTRLLPWLTLDDVLAGIRETGQLSGHLPKAEAIAGEMSRRLKVQPPATGPRVLLAMDGTPGQLKEVWFLRQNCIHGACLNAAGGRNAVDDEVVGVVPVLSLERVIALDPEIVLILAARNLSEDERRQIVEDWKGLPMLTAVKNSRVRVLDGREYYINGPRILELIDKLQFALRRE